MKNWLPKSIVALLVAFITAGWILLDIEYKPDSANEVIPTDVTLESVKENIVIKPTEELNIILTKKQGSFTKEPSEKIIARFTPVVLEEEHYEPSMEELLDVELTILPDNLLNYLYDNDWEIELTDMNLAEEFDFPMQIAGLTYYDTKTIYISNADEYYIRRVTLHEVGHAFAYQANEADLTNEFLKIYEEERYNFVDCTSIGDGHEFSDSQEYFASVFQNIYLNYDETVANVPKTVYYIENVIYNTLEEYKNE